MLSSRPALIGFALVAALNAPLDAKDDHVQPFPLRAIDSESTDAITLEPIPSLIRSLAPLDRVTFIDVALPDMAPATLDLERIAVAPDGTAIYVDGEHVGSDTSHLNLSLWKGSVRGERGSDVFLSFSSFGSRGWISRGNETIHLAVQPDAVAGWAKSTNSFVRQSMLTELGVGPELACHSDSVRHATQPSLPMPQGSSPEASYSGGTLPYYDARIALETDYQFYQLFNDLPATQVYAFSLFGAVSDRYREQVGAIFSMPYVGFYTSNNDPWVNQDLGGSSIDVLYEFQDAWDNGAAPVTADLYTLWSGAGLGGGVAYLDVLCDQDYGFSVSGNLAALTPIPIIPNNAFNWDFMVTAHEFGHNFATPHTHDYCPPIDQCAPDGYFGQCQTSEQCTPVGTIMSYCHLCDGGLENVTTFFHPEVVNTVRSAIVNSCMPLFAGVFTEDLGAAKAGANGVPNLDVSFTTGANTLDLTLTNLTPGAPGVLYISASQINAPFKGGTLVPSPDIAINLAPGGATQSLGGPVSGLPDGIELVTQAWFKDGSNLWSSTNGVAFELIVP